MLPDRILGGSLATNQPRYLLTILSNIYHYEAAYNTGWKPTETLPGDPLNDLRGELTRNLPGKQHAW